MISSSSVSAGEKWRRRNRRSNGNALRILSGNCVVRRVRLTRELLEYMQRFRLQSLFSVTGSYSLVALQMSVLLTSVALCLFVAGNLESHPDFGQYEIYSVTLSPASPPPAFNPEPFDKKMELETKIENEVALMEVDDIMEEEVLVPDAKLVVEQISETVQDKTIAEPEVREIAHPPPVLKPAPMNIPKVVSPSIKKEPLPVKTQSAVARSSQTNSVPVRGGGAMVAQQKSSTGQGKASDVGGKSLSKDSGGDGRMISAYWQDVSRAIAGNLRYPLSARARGQEGVIKLKLIINAQGRLVSVSSVSSSTSDRSLCNAAIQAVYRTAPFSPPVVKSIKSDSLTAELPVRFELTNGKWRGELE